MTRRDESEQDRAAALVRSTPIRPEVIRERSYVPASVRYGERWKSLPVERLAAPRSSLAMDVFSLGLAGMILVYMLARVLVACL